MKQLADISIFNAIAVVKPDRDSRIGGLRDAAKDVGILRSSFTNVARYLDRGDLKRFLEEANRIDAARERDEPGWMKNQYFNHPYFNKEYRDMMVERQKAINLYHAKKKTQDYTHEGYWSNTVLGIGATKQQAEADATIWKHKRDIFVKMLEIANASKNFTRWYTDAYNFVNRIEQTKAKNTDNRSIPVYKELKKLKAFNKPYITNLLDQYVQHSAWFQNAMREVKQSVDK
jgi:hypothetical protein